MKKIYLVLTILISILLSGCAGNTLDSFFESLNIPSTITEDLNLQESYQYQGQTINVTWDTTNENIITSTGVITQTTVEQQAILTAKATLGNETKTRTFVVVIAADNTTLILQSATQKFGIPQRLDQGITLPVEQQVNEYDALVSISWNSSHPAIMTTAGAITLPPAETTVTLTATFTYNGQSLVKEYTVTIAKDPNYSVGDVWATGSLYTDEIEGEIAPVSQYEFAGALYRKVVSSKDYWLGIEVVVTLPEFVPDEGRTGTNPWGSENDMRYLDNASVYLGANAGYESDVGLSWSLGLGANGSVDYSKSVAFRPFWRYIVPGDNIYQNASVSDTHFYYYPGDKVRMSVYSPRENYLQLRIELLEETTIEKYVAVRNSYNLGDDYEKVFISPEFSSGGAGVVKTLFKRVCALDQVNNEGKPTQPTNAKSINTIWHECYLYREINGIVYKVPLTSDRRYEMYSPSNGNALDSFANAFVITTDGVDTSLGGEVVTISPNNRK